MGCAPENVTGPEPGLFQCRKAKKVTIEHDGGCWDLKIQIATFSGAQPSLWLDHIGEKNARQHPAHV